MITLADRNQTHDTGQIETHEQLMADTLAVCLEEIERGQEVNTVLAGRPRESAEIKPLLEIALLLWRRKAFIAGPALSS